MSIFGALSAAVSGLRAQSTSLEHVSGNIANSQTTGYKRTDTRFVDYVPDAIVDQQMSKGVNAFSRATNDVQGAVNSVDVATNMAINGDGYFMIGQSSGYADDQAVFDNTSLYTRRGDFAIDRDGYLVNGAGYYLKGLMIDQVTGNVSSSNPEVIRINNDFLPAQESTRIDYRANLPDYPRTNNADENILNSERIDPADFADYAAGITADEESAFLDSSITGGAVTVYDEAGNALDMQLRWAKVYDDTAPADDQPDTWNLFYQSNSAAADAETKWTRVDADYTFEAGRIQGGMDEVELTGLNVNGIELNDILLRHGANGMTQFADSNGTAQVTELGQNGYAAGELIGVAVNNRGQIQASYTNGETVSIAEVTLASFNADNMLKKLDGGAFAETDESGSAILGAQGSISGSALESSNADIAEEFSKLITTQQAYSASTRIVTTSDEMMQEAVNMVR